MGKSKKAARSSKKRGNGGGKGRSAGSPLPALQISYTVLLALILALVVAPTNGVKEEDQPIASGSILPSKQERQRVATVDGENRVTASPGIVFDSSTQTLHLPAVAAFSREFKVHSDVNMMNHTIKNATFHMDTLNVEGAAKVKSSLQVKGSMTVGNDLLVDGYVLGRGPYVDISDRRAKINVETIDSTDVLEKLLQLDGVVYELDAANLLDHRRKGDVDGEPTKGRRQIGFIAQDVELHFPQLVHADEREFKGVFYARFVPLLVEGLKAQEKRIEEMERRVEELGRQVCGD